MNRPTELYGITSRVKTGRGNLYVTINMSKDKPFEVFTTHGKAGGNDAAMAEAVSRIVSLCLRSGIDPKEVIKQLRGITDIPAWDEGNLIRSVPDALAMVLEKITSDKKDNITNEGTQESMFSDRTKSKKLEESTQPTMINLPDNETVTVKVTTGNNITQNCPDCEIGNLAFEEGCQKCYSCGYSKC
jgi:ribonucleoside-diphosphate reductase alpha chain